MTSVVFRIGGDAAAKNLVGRPQLEKRMLVETDFILNRSRAKVKSRTHLGQDICDAERL
jgi:hypothetical protein